MLLAVVLLAPFAVSPLDVFQALFFALRSGEIFHFAVVEILAIVGVGMEWIFISHHFVGVVLIDVVDLLAIETDRQRPTTLHLAVLVQNVLG